MMDARTRRKITQEVGAIVSENGETGEVVGHYDDDSVYVLFDGKTEPERVWVEALTLVESNKTESPNKKKKS